MPGCHSPLHNPGFLKNLGSAVRSISLPSRNIQVIRLPATSRTSTMTWSSNWRSIWDLKTRNQRPFCRGHGILSTMQALQLQALNLHPGEMPKNAAIRFASKRWRPHVAPSILPSKETNEKIHPFKRWRRWDVRCQGLMIWIFWM